MYDVLTQDIKYLKGVGPARAALFNEELGVSSLRDLLYCFPYKYIDRSRIYTLAEIVPGMPYVQLKGHIVCVEVDGEGRKRRLKAVFTDGNNSAELVWFQGIKTLQKSLKTRVDYLLFGTPSSFNGVLQFVHPELDLLDGTEKTLERGLQAIYRIPEKLKRHHVTSKMVGALVKNVFSQLKHPIEETLPDYLVKGNGLLPLSDALRMIHFPNSSEEIPSALHRLKFEELFYIQLNILRYVKDRNIRYKGYRFTSVGECFLQFYHECLPFELTNAQKRVIKEMRRDMGSGRQMNRLLQGDVGSGKTIVSLMGMLLAVDNGYQSCIIAPTEILAEQHYQTMQAQAEGVGIKIALLTGNIKGKKRQEILEQVEKGEIQILVGTHALLEKWVIFARLGFVVIDEQHRFGVEQRAKLWAKSENPPHILVMTATPIPRTLAMTLYGDLDVSIIDELPPGRKPIQTLHCYQSNVTKVYEGIHRELQVGRQVYIVYPIIKESESMDIQNLEDGYEKIQKVFSQYHVGMLHGKMKPAEKEQVMQMFASGQMHILVATTVIEVGVNVPNASVMVIENAERFGLAQLHQLRGRVGRGADQSYCILMTGYKLSETTRKRMQIMVETCNGFEIAEEDLKLRGPGDLEGTQQSGIAFDLKIANITKDSLILEQARTVAAKVLENDPLEKDPNNQLLWRQLKLLRRKNINWSAIS